MKLNSKRFLGFQEYQSILLLDVTLTISLSQFVYTACDWLKAVGGKDGCVGKVVGGHYSGNFNNLWVWQPGLDKFIHFEN